MNEPEEPECPLGRKPHRQRVADINALLMPGTTAGICIDNTEGHCAFYLAELKKYPNLRIVYQGPLSPEVYLIEVQKS
jgi:hypothetical protein